MIDQITGSHARNRACVQKDDSAKEQKWDGNVK